MRVPYVLDTALRRMAHKTWGAKNRAQFYRRMGGMVRNGMNLAKSARILESRAKKRPGAWAYDPNVLALGEIATRIENGSSFEAALAGWVPPADLSIIAAGARSGTLPEAIDLVLNSGKAAQRIRNSIIKELWEPMIFLGAVIYLIDLVGTQVVPAMEGVVPVAQWPLTAKLLLPMAYLTTGWPALAAMVIMGVGIPATLYSLPRWVDNGRRFADHVVPWSVYRVIQGSSWISGFTSLIQSGERIESALNIQARLATPWLRKRLLAARSRVMNGSDIGTALASTGYGFPDATLIEDISVFAGHADFPHVLKRLGDEWMADQEIKIGAAIKVFSTVVTIAVNMLMLLTVLGMNSLQTLISATH